MTFWDITCSVHGLRLRAGKLPQVRFPKGEGCGKPSSRKAAGGHRRVPRDVGKTQAVATSDQSESWVRTIIIIIVVVVILIAEEKMKII